MKEDYEAKRNELMAQAQALLDEGKTDEAEVVMADIQKLDDDFEKYATIQANLRAMKDVRPVVDLADMTIADKTEPEDDEPKEDAYRTEAYTNAWAKFMMGKALDDAEYETMHMVNEDFTHTTENTPVVIPETVADRIWREIGDKFPLWDDVLKTYVSGKLTVIKSDSSTDAAWYVEDTETEDGKEVFGAVELNGCELARSITVSWKLKEMAVSDFLSYIQTRMAEKMGAGLGYGVAQGAGVVSGQPSEPTGILTAIEGTDQIISSDDVSYADLTAARGAIHSGFAPAVYANSATIWKVLANVCDQNGRPVFMADPAAGGLYRVLGCIVKEDASIPDGTILFADASAYHANINKQITVLSEDHVKPRTTDYCGYAIVDGAPMSIYAFAAVEKN